MSKFNVSDVVVGNSGANKYNVTIEGWYGIVTEVDAAGEREYITVKPAISIGVNEWIVNPKDQAQYRVLSSCFNVVTIAVQQPSPSKEAIYNAISQINTFVKIDGVHYSLSSLVGMIKCVEEPKAVEPGKIMLNENDYDSFLDSVRERFEANFSGYGGSKFIDTDSAEFSLNGNRIELDSVELDSDEVVDTAMECLENVLNQYVVVLEKSDSLEA